jgi:hypothetical protein
MRALPPPTLGTFLYTNCGKIRVDVDGVTSDHDLFLSEYEGKVASIKVRGGVAAGNHTVTMTALFDKHAASTGYYFYFDYLWPLVPQDVPDAPQEYDDVSLAIDFDTDHGYKKPPAWHLWQLQKLGFKGHADVYMGVFWNNKRQRVGASYPYATIAFAGTPAPGETVSISIGGSNVTHVIGYGETLQDLVSHMRATINGMFAGVWAEAAPAHQRRRATRSDLSALLNADIECGEGGWRSPTLGAEDVVVSKAHAGTRQPVEVGGPDVRVTVRSDGVGPLVVGQ